jgi:DNA-binding HxlR family transcriptional regulator
MPSRIKADSAIKIVLKERLDAYQQFHDPLRERCSGRAAIDVVRGRWKASILHYLRTAPRRFLELQKKLRGITDQTLTVQLRQLEADGVIQRARHVGSPPVVEYSLTESGKNLSRIMQQLETWGADYLARRRTADSLF